MSRVKRGTKARQRRNKILKLAKGFHFDRRTKYRHAIQTVHRALNCAYVNRRKFKRDIRRLWSIRIGAAAKQLGGSYSKLMSALGKKEVLINRKMLSEIAARDFDGFKAIFDTVQS